MRIQFRQLLKYKKKAWIASAVAIVILSCVVFALTTKNSLPEKAEIIVSNILTVDSQPQGVTISSNCSVQNNTTPYECTATASVELEAPLEYIDYGGQVFAFKEWQGCDTAENNKCYKYPGNSKARVTVFYDQKPANSPAPASISKTTKPAQKYCTNPELSSGEYACPLTITEIPKLVKINLAVHSKEPSYAVRWEPWDYSCERHDGLYEPPCTLENPKTIPSYFTSNDTAQVLVHSKSNMEIKFPEYVQSQDCGVRVYSPCFGYEQYSFAGFMVHADQGEDYQVTANYNFQCYLQEPKVPSAQYPFETYRC